MCQGSKVIHSLHSDASLDVFEVVQETSEAEPLWPASAERGKKVAMRDPKKTAKICEDRAWPTCCSGGDDEALHQRLLEARGESEKLEHAERKK